jgi:hypothetical protein
LKDCGDFNRLKTGVKSAYSIENDKYFIFASEFWQIFKPGIDGKSKIQNPKSKI